MKTNNANTSKPQQARTHKDSIPENKDNLDSRKNEEWDVKGEDKTHNKKEVRSERKSKP